ncbi:hypothetical protein vseg_011537 [Gypsophila vaccaria]
MGNCCMHNGSKSATVWAGDDWGAVVSEKPASEKEGLIVKDGEGSNIGGQVRITISKKQLEKLLRKVDKSSLSGNNNSSQMKKMKGGGQILQKIIDKSHHFEVHHLRTWKPALQSIPEVD